MCWNRKQWCELFNMKWFLAAKSDQVLASPPINHLQELVHSASGYGSVKQKRGYIALISATVCRCYIKISSWGAVPGSYSSHFEMKWRKRITPTAVPWHRHETRARSWPPCIPQASSQRWGWPITSHTCRGGTGESSAAGGTCRKLEPCNRDFASVSWPDISLAI